METVYCRFCINPSSYAKVIDLNSEKNTHEDVVEKLSQLPININLTEECILPKTICSECYMALTEVCKFLIKINNSQVVLQDIFSMKIECRNIPLSQEDCIFNEIKVKLENKQHNKYISDVEDNLDHTSDSCDFKMKQIDSSELLSNSQLCTIYENSKFEHTSTANGVLNEDGSEIESWDSYKWKCRHCGESFYSLSELRSHSKDIHNKCYAFACNDCTREQNNFNTFIKHVTMHRKHLRNYCVYCNQCIKNKMNKAHLETHVTPPQKSCKSCGEIFPNTELLHTHTQQYNNIADTSNKIKKHRVYYSHNITVEDLTCKICYKVYKSRNSVRDHQKLHDVDRKKDYTCDRCGKAFFNKGTLKAHILTHEDMKPYVCKICNKSFSILAKLRAHVDIHSGTKAFTCEECGRRFRLKEQLKQHMIIHTDQMPYKCDVCGKSFRFRQILKNHERQHSGAKPYSCEMCGMVFTNWANYNKHMVRKHKMDMSKKKITPDGTFPVNPETGKVISIVDHHTTEEWKSKIMIPMKRGKKKRVDTTKIS